MMNFTNNFTNLTNCAETAMMVNKVMGFVPPNCEYVRQFYIILANQMQARQGAKFSIIFIAICVPMLLIQLTSLPIFLIVKQFRENSCFRILFVNGIVDSIQLATYLIYAILNLYMDTTPISPRVQQIGAAFSIPVWSVVVFLHLVLALNRLIVILRPQYFSSKWMPNQKTEKRIFSIALLFSALLFFGLVGLFLTPYVGGNLHRGTMVFRFDDRLPYTRTYHAWIWWAEGWIPVICFGIYIFIIYTLRKSRKITCRKNRPRNLHIENEKELEEVQELGHPPLLNDLERRLLIQALILYSLMFAMMLGWHFIDECVVSYTNTLCTAHLFGHSIFTISMQTHAILFEVPWMIYCGLGPILLLVMSKEFRTKYIQLYMCKVHKAVENNATTNVN